MSTPLPAIEESARRLATTLSGCLPDDIGFTLWLWSKGDAGHLTYISNGQREDMIAAVKEWLARMEGRAVASVAEGLQ